MNAIKQPQLNNAQELMEVLKAFNQLSATDKKGVTAFGLGLMAGLELAAKKTA